VTGSRLYVARDEKVTVVTRSRMRMAGGQLVSRPWRALVETTTRTLDPQPRRSAADAAMVVLPPVAAAVVTTAFAPIEAGFAAGGVVFFAMAYLAPALRRRRAAKGPRTTGADIRLLSAPKERAAFARAVDTADRISETWPSLGSLVNVPEAEAMLADALWEIAGVLTRRQDLNTVLAELSRPDFAGAPPGDETARELRAHLTATKAALSDLEIELARREASLRRAEEAGRAFIREQEMRRAIRAAEESLRAVQRPELQPATPPDAGAELAEQTQSVLAAYRELTADLRPDAPL
jgi:hypothetical protein